ncbi:hypothetical protein [Devosia sp. DBB001]|nr:hypothetical protein [Devosia sp. DBB001]
MGRRSESRRTLDRAGAKKLPVLSDLKKSHALRREVERP